MPELIDWISALLPGVGTILLAILSGAGGSALLDLYWKPRRDRRRAAALLHADIIMNMQLIQLHAHLRKNAPRRIPQDLKLSRLGFDTAGEIISELPTELLRPLLLLYNRIDDLNRNVDLYAQGMDELDTIDPAPRVGQHARRPEGHLVRRAQGLVTEVGAGEILILEFVSKACATGSRCLLITPTGHATEAPLQQGNEWGTRSGCRAGR